MRRIFLAALPVLLFVGALMALNSNAPAQPEPAAAPAPPAYTPPAGSGTFSNDSAPPSAVSPEPVTAPAPSPAPQPKQVTYASVKECSDGSGTIAYVHDGIIQIQPAAGKSAQCAAPVAVIQDGKRYFGCADGGKIILDCDWYVQTIGSENQGQNAAFGSSYLEDFSAPDISGFSCRDAKIDSALLLGPNGTICDVQTLTGNIIQAHGG